MGLFNRIFGKWINKEDKKPSIRFGRFSEIYKTPDQIEAWKIAFKAFEEEDYLTSYKQFFNYLNDPNQDNITVSEENDQINFEILQGSKKIAGTADKEKIKATIKVVHCEQFNVGFMRRLLDQNFGLKHCRFALNQDNDICMKMDAFTVDGSPFKIYAGLKEMATKSDKLDDLLLDEFQMLKPIDNGHILELPKAEVDIKFQFLMHWYDQLQESITKLNSTKDAIAVSVLIRYFIYKSDYLVQPEGFLMELFEKCHHIFYARDKNTLEQKNNLILKELKVIKTRGRAKFDKELYKVPATFGITTAVDHAWVSGVIDMELSNMDWFRKNNFEDISVHLAGYISTYSLFNYAVPQPDREYFHLLVEILETDFFEALDIKHEYYNKTSKKLNKSAIRNEINAITKANREKFPKLSPDVGSLKFKSLPIFVKTFILMVKNLDLTTAD